MTSFAPRLWDLLCGRLVLEVEVLGSQDIWMAVLAPDQFTLVLREPSALAARSHFIPARYRARTREANPSKKFSGSTADPLNCAGLAKGPGRAR